MNPQIMSHKLEKLVWDTITNTMTDPEKLKEYVIGYTDDKQSTKIKLEEELSNVSDTLKKLTDEKQSILEKYANGDVSKDSYSQQSFKLDAQVQQIKAQQNDTLSKLTELKGSDVLSTSLDQYCTTLKLRLDKANSFDTKRRLLLDNCIEVTKGNKSVVLGGTIRNTNQESELHFSVTTQIN